MRSLTFLTISAFLVLCFSGSSEAAENFTLCVGHREYGDYLMEHHEYRENHTPGQHKLRIQTYKGNGVDIITSVQAIDMWVDSENTGPRIMSGGPGFTYVTIQFWTKCGHGIHFLIKVYAKPDVSE